MKKFMEAIGATLMYGTVFIPASGVVCITALCMYLLWKYLLAWVFACLLVYPMVCKKASVWEVVRFTLVSSVQIFMPIAGVGFALLVDGYGIQEVEEVAATAWEYIGPWYAYILLCSSVSVGFLSVYWEEKWEQLLDL